MFYLAYSINLYRCRMINEATEKRSLRAITKTQYCRPIAAKAAVPCNGIEMHVLDTTQIGAWDWDINTGRVIFNERRAKMRGYRPDKIEPHIDAWESGIYPADFPAYDSALTAHLENRTPFFQAEYRIRTLSGSLVWLLTRGTVIKRDSEGNPLHMVGIEMDITEHRTNNKTNTLKS